MHISLLLAALGIAIALRLIWRPALEKTPLAWGMALSAFLVPPLVLLTTAVAVLAMGAQGNMFSIPVGIVGYLLGSGCLAIALGMLAYRGWQGWRSLHQIQSFPPLNRPNCQGYLLQTPALFAAQIGFWHPRLVLSDGLLTTLSPEQLEAVLTHEQAHLHYHDTFWFFWLGWIRDLTAWLPNTPLLWQELLLLREMRADRYAVQSADPLVLAEALLQVAQSPLHMAVANCVALHDAAPIRLEQRIDALLAEPQAIAPTSPKLQWLKWLWVLLPLLSVPFHS
ncbi:M56 family metallopeptidase [Vacuolonema iberomarrocanum]|uniref:M56 family metallopeptidase n=1 Tax=Vacuolonema iberomarrocanum TaxID=3454632 RepID=UPI001A01AF24|nr:M56 family metallopeptidase [filamentous cyanobacterium LEGE 07170]